MYIEVLIRFTIQENDMNLEALEKAICDTIKEQQIKLGYVYETIRLYYPMSSLAHILEEEVGDTDSMDRLLDQFMLRMKNTLGKLEYSHKGERYCVLIPPQGGQYIHENYEESPFLRALIEVVRKHNCTIDQVLEVFQRFSSQVVCEESNIADFDYVIYFADSTMEDYRYCIKLEQGHLIYHRFTRKDYENL